MGKFVWDCILFHILWSSYNISPRRCFRVFEQKMAFSKGSRLVDSLLSNEGPGIIRTDLRYVVIQGSSMHIFISAKKEAEKSEADNVKILKITKDMSVESTLISQRYGRCIEVKNRKNSNSTVCTYQSLSDQTEMLILTVTEIPICDQFSYC